MKSLNDYLEDIDVSDSMYELATARYESLVDFIQKGQEERGYFLFDFGEVH